MNQIATGLFRRPHLNSRMLALACGVSLSCEKLTLLLLAFLPRIPAPYGLGTAAFTSFEYLLSCPCALIPVTT